MSSDDIITDGVDAEKTQNCTTEEDEPHNSGTPAEVSCNAENQLEGTRFDPPLYRQRYRHVADVLQEERVVTVADLGCSEHKVIPVYKSVPTIESICGVDLDLEALSCNRHLLKPLITDYLIRRSRPLKIRLFQGDAGIYDSRLAGIEAVTLIEVIEHLYTDVLQRVSHNVFVNIQPRLVVMTTPNSEYNIVFGERTGFRHWDHKFEWTRAEFQQWCGDQAKQYNYTVTYSGIGEPPPDLAHVGHCSQMALFRCNWDWSPSTTTEDLSDTPYILVEECIHPHQEVTLSRSETIVMETRYYLHLLTHQLQHGDSEPQQDAECSYDYDMEQLHVTPEYLWQFSRIQDVCDNVEAFQSTLQEEGFEFSLDKKYIIYSPPQPESSDDSDHQDEHFLCTTEELQNGSNTEDRQLRNDSGSDWES